MESIYLIKQDLNSDDGIELQEEISGMSSRERQLNFDEFTFIDWNHEAALQSDSPILTVRKWMVILLLALFVGYVTSMIDIFSVLLSDLKKGLCLSKLENWSLANPYLTCPAGDWKNWSEVLFSSDSVVLTVLVNFPIYILLAAVLAFLASYITVKKELFIRLSGIPEIKMIIYGMQCDFTRILGPRALFYKCLGLVFVVSSGMWLGKEGPLVHVSCCISYILYKRLVAPIQANEADEREILSVATATGIAVAFNAPIGGVLFLLESMSIFFTPDKIMWASFLSSTVAVIALSGSKIFTDGKSFHEQELFPVEFVNFSWLFIELVPFIMIGVLGGFYGFFVIRLNSRFTERFRDNVRDRLCQVFKVSISHGKYLEVMVLLVITTLLNFPLELTRLPLLSFLKVLFTECSQDPQTENDLNSHNIMCSSSDLTTGFKLLYIAVQGFFLFCYSYGTYLPGGILTPSLVLGGTIGRILGIVFLQLQNFLQLESHATCTEKSCLISPPSYAVIGAASFMTGITKFSMSVVVIIFELTGAVTYVLPIMCSVLILKFVNDWLCEDNLYDTWLKKNFSLPELNSSIVDEGKGSGLCDFHTLNLFDKESIPFVAVSDIMVPNLRTKCIYFIPDIPFTIRSLIKFLNDDNHEGYPVLVSKTNGISMGYITKRKLFDKLFNFDHTLQDHFLRFSNLEASKEMLSMQEKTYSTIPSHQIVDFELDLTSSKMIVNDKAPIIQVLEIFEKLNLNYLIIFDSKCLLQKVMAGFIDRFILSRTLNSNFSEIHLRDEGLADIQAFEIEDTTISDDPMNILADQTCRHLIT